MSDATMTYFWEDDLLEGHEALDGRLRRAWGEIEAVLPSVDAIAWDGCHKIYLLMNKQQTYYMQDYPMLLRAEHASVEGLMLTIQEWYDDSCPLVFIQGCDGPMEETEFVSYIPQIFGGSDERTYP